MKTWKENHIFLLHSKENKCGIISKLFVSLIHPETKGTNITLYSVTNDVKVGIPLWQERWLQEHSEKARCRAVLHSVLQIYVCMEKFLTVHVALLHLLIRYFLPLWFCHVCVHLWFALEGPCSKKCLASSNFPETTEILVCFSLRQKLRT